MPIHILPQDVADKIAAGEVIERPASVVKELIENSLDAGATDIRIEIADGGKRLIRVIDNGKGIPAHEAPLAFQRHATSKIRSADELEHIATLGFRGEALAAISAVSKATLITRTPEASAGIEIKLEGSKLLSQRSIGTPPGTSLTIEHLFWNTPARLKFLRTDATEAGHISKIVTRYALAYPDVRFSYISRGRLSFQTPGSGDRMAALVKVYGAEIAAQMLPVHPATDAISPEIQVSGFVSAPSLHRANRSYIELFINHRYIQDRNLTYAIIQAYHTLLMVGRYPLAVLFIDMPPELVDVNVHPTKAEVRFRQASMVFRAVQRAVHSALQGLAPITRELQTEPPPGPWGQRRQILMQAGQEQTTPGQLAMDLYRQGAHLAGDETPLVGQDTVTAPPRPHPPQPDEGRLPPLRPVGQIAATYLIAEGPDGMYLIDQHAAHERILFEKIMKAAQQPIARQQLLQPVPIELGTQLAGLIAEHLDALQKSGFNIETFGEGSYLLRAVPAFMGKQDPQRLLEEVAAGLADRNDLIGEAREEAIVTTICKRLAIKGGQVLSVAEQRELLRQLEQCDNPRSCPHGRPTMLHLSANALERQFGRLGA
jgi:DNA mismatch repair protein MutL